MSSQVRAATGGRASVGDPAFCGKNRRCRKDRSLCGGTPPKPCTSLRAPSMSAAELGLSVSVFLACAVESVEALTIVMAVGQTRGWPSALAGVGAAVLALAAIVAALGTALTSLPIDELRVLIGALLLIFGVQWLRKAILRAAGLKAPHDEHETYEQQSAAA